MKKIILILLLLINPLYAFGLEEITLDENIQEDKPFIEKLFKDKKEITFKNSFINSISEELRFRGNATFEDIEKEKTGKYPFDINLILESKFQENKSKFYASYMFTDDIDNVSNKFLSRFTHLYIEREINENHKIKIGTQRAPIGDEGAQSAFTIPLARRSQIGRTMGNSIVTGISANGKYKAFDYDIGGYSSTRFTQGIKDGVDLIGRIGYSPAKDLKFYAGGDIGHKDKDYQSYFLTAHYKHKKFRLDGEYAYANGYNGRAYSTNEAMGFFTTATYNLTEKLEMIARYDYFDYNLDAKKSSRVEYTAGLNYLIFKERLRFALNYVFSDDRRSDKKGHGVYFITQFYI